MNNATFNLTDIMQNGNGHDHTPEHEEDNTTLMYDFLENVEERRIFGKPDRVRDNIVHTLKHSYMTNTDVPLGARNAITLIKGREGSRKSTLASCLLSSRFTERDTLGFNVNLERDEVILHFDTEMTMEESEEFKEAFNDRANLDPEDSVYMVYNIRDYSPRS